MDPNTNYANYSGYSSAPTPTNPKAPSSSKKLLIVVVGGIGIISVIMVILALIFGGTSAKQQLISAAADQQEIIRVATLVDESRTANAKTRNLASITKVTATSNQTDILAHLEKSYDSKPKPELLRASLDQESTTKLASADQNNNYDDTFKTIIIPLLRSAITSINEALEANSKDDTEAVLKNIQERNTLLLNFFTSE